jgi:hypothetical protein
VEWSERSGLDDDRSNERQAGSESRNATPPLALAAVVASQPATAPGGAGAGPGGPPNDSRSAARVSQSATNNTSLHWAAWELPFSAPPALSYQTDAGLAGKERRYNFPLGGLFDRGMEWGWMDGRTQSGKTDEEEGRGHAGGGRPRLPWTLAVEVGPVEQRQAARGVNDELLASEHHQPSYPATTAHRASGVSGNRVGVGPAASEAPTEPWFTGCGLRRPTGPV